MLVIVAAIIMINTFSTMHSRSPNSTAQADVRNTAIAQEAYYVDNQTYADSIEKLIGNTYGLYLSENVTVKVLSASENDYVIEAFHKEGDKKYTLTGPGGGIQEQNR